MKMIGVHEFRSLPEGLLVDVRTPAEFAQAHAPGAALLPLSNLDGEEVSHLAAGKPVYLMCQSGNRARQAADKLKKAGVNAVSVIQGGMNAWEAAGLPLERGQTMMSLERQVRIAAGAFALLGVVLGFFIHPALYALSGFVGAGLIFAGITDTCGMGLLLARMPWNTRISCSNRSCKPANIAGAN
jgi:rhodanese-related sulfurtransferase